ncbi:hypothetical protein WMY93_024481 [Mugilogobius chulae]|uniref:EGF-like domain-containing protein n=1 Tax=Mugilogobius chulae TaxID=88201 RepID=A0AAW0NCB0_9GOBI
MNHLWSLLSALLLLLSYCQSLSSEENEVLKPVQFNKSLLIENAIGNISETESQTPTNSPTWNTTLTPVKNTSTTLYCPGNQIFLENSTDCGCPFHLVKNGDDCYCPQGFTLTGEMECEDVDECNEEALGPCGPHAICSNTPGSYSCSCLHGYLMGATGCQDIDECGLAKVTGLQACPSNAECKNTIGSFHCFCPLGYVMALNGHVVLM